MQYFFTYIKIPWINPVYVEIFTAVIGVLWSYRPIKKFIYS